MPATARTPTIAGAPVTPEMPATSEMPSTACSYCMKASNSRDNNKRGYTRRRRDVSNKRDTSNSSRNAGYRKDTCNSRSATTMAATTGTTITIRTPRITGTPEQHGWHHP